VSNSLVVGTILDSLIACIHSAWDGVVTPPDVVTVSEDDEPRTIQDLPFVSLSWEKVKISFDGLNSSVSQTNHLYNFDILLEFPMPPPTGTNAGRISRLKATWASLLINQIQTGPTFAGVANMPILSEVDPVEKTPRFEGAGMMALKFQCQTGINYLNV
jgi:hypothetical protein